MSRPPSALLVGDHFIPAEFYADALARTVGGPMEEMTMFELAGSKKRQHEDQQLMEAGGPAVVEVAPDLIEAMRAHDLVIVHFAPVPEAVFGSGSRVRGVFAARTGVENVDLDAASASRVPVFNVHGRNASAVAELSLGLMLAEGRNIARADRSVKDGGWRKDFAMTPVEIGGSTVGLVGFGHVGHELAKRLRGFEAEVLVFDPYVDPDLVEGCGARLTDLEVLFSTSDFISLQARVTPESTGMIDAGLIGKMKPTAFLVNVGRSRLVNTQDLISALEVNAIAGAALDVFDSEPLEADSPLRRLDNVTLTTHFGGDTVTTNRTSARLVAESIDRFLAGDGIADAVNAAALAT